MLNKVVLRKELVKLKNKLGLYGGGLELLTMDEFRAQINPKNWDIKVSTKKDWEPSEAVTDYCAREQVTNPLRSMVESLLIHEVYHWKTCPYDLATHQEILNQVSKTLKEQDKYSKHLSNYITNAFEDLIIDKETYYHEDSEGLIIDILNNICDVKVPFRKAFFALNTYSLRKKDRQVLNKNLRLTDEEVRAVQKTIGLTGLKRGPQEFRKELMPYLAGRFTQGLIELINKGDELGENKNSFQELLESDEGMKKAVKERFKNGLGKPEYLSSEEYLLKLYDSLSSELIILADSKKQGWSLPLVPYAHKAFDPETDDPNKINPRKGLRLNNDGKLMFQVPRHYFSFNVPVKVAEGGMPDFVFFLDASSSMEDEEVGDRSGIPWGVNSKYHKALLGFFSALNYLKNKGYSKYITHELVMFSSKSKSSGRKSYRELDVIKRMALNPDLQSTYLDLGVISEVLDCDPCVVMMLTDGEIFNWGEVKEDFRKLISPHYFTLIQLDDLYESTKDIIKWGKQVHHLKNADDLDKLIIDLTREEYNGGVNNA